MAIGSAVILARRTSTEAAAAGAARRGPGRLGVGSFSGETECIDQLDDSRLARTPSRLAVALTVSVLAHACIFSLVSKQPQYPWAQAPGAIEVRIIPVTAAGVGHTEPAAELIESAPIAFSDATALATGETITRTASRLPASHVEKVPTRDQRQALDAPMPMLELPAIVTPDAAPPPSPIYYAESEVDAIPAALDPIVPRYPSGAEGTDGGKVTLRLLIDTGGVVKDVAVVETGLSEVFEESARNAFAGTRFKPAEKDGVPVGCQTVISIVYAPSGIPHALR